MPCQKSTVMLQRLIRSVINLSAHFGVNVEFFNNYLKVSIRL